MPRHYIFVDEPDPTTLCQGDVLSRTDELVEVLKQFHPHYAAHRSYKHFLVLTQTCDLVRRGDGPPNSHYISIAAVRPVGEALQRVAKKHQEWWQEPTKVLDEKGYERLKMFAESLLDNNQPNYFYLHEDATIGLVDQSCAFLALSVALKTEHYERCLRAKVAELQESFQAKLGWLIGNMYSRIGTSEWNEHYGPGKSAKEAAALLAKSFVRLKADQVKVGVRELTAERRLEDYSPNEILEHIVKATVVSRDRQLWDRAQKLITEFNIPNKFSSYLISHLREGGRLARAIEAALAEKSVDHAAEVAAEVQRVVFTAIGDAVEDEGFSGREKLLAKLMGALRPDAVIKSVLTT
jgi:hypothetical protein